MVISKNLSSRDHGQTRRRQSGVYVDMKWRSRSGIEETDIAAEIDVTTRATFFCHRSVNACG
ncbi:MAG TPA: hypothetical protein VNI77_00660 [Nitrososphaera sp.]|nr:hypothetical protein [Nitrososphaera sp.]